jgi:hypothetical protein
MGINPNPWIFIKPSFSFYQSVFLIFLPICKKKPASNRTPRHDQNPYKIHQTSRYIGNQSTPWDQIQMATETLGQGGPLRHYSF